MMKSLDQPSKVIERVIQLAKDLRIALDNRNRERLPEEKADPRRDRKQIVQVERALRRYLAQQPMSTLAVLMRVARVGTGEVPVEEAVSLANPTRSERLDLLVDALVAEIHLANYLKRGLIELAKHSVDVDLPPR